MKFLLVKPPVSLNAARQLLGLLHLEPLDLEIVAGGIGLRHETRIQDLTTVRHPLRAFRKTLSAWQPDVLGLTAYSSQAAHVLTLCAIAKEQCPDTRTLVGGVHATIAPGYFADAPSVDWLVRGEGGTAMRAIVACLEQGRPPPENERVLHVHSSRFAALAALPPPALPAAAGSIPPARRDLVDRRRYFSVWHGQPGERLPALFPQTATLRTSVGCPHRCAFCAVPYICGGRYLRKTPEAAVAEIAAVAEKHIYFVDDEMFVDAGRAMEMARRLVQRGIRKRYISWARCDTIVRHPELFQRWKEAGLDLLYVGIESMNDQNLKSYNKRCDAGTNRAAVRILRKMGIGLHAALMVNPDFDREDFLEVRQTVRELAPCEISFTVFSPPPGTPLWETHRARFVCPDPYAFYDCMHTLLPTTLPLKTFYRYFSLLYLYAFRDNPWRRDRIGAPLGEKIRFLRNGLRFGWALRNIHKDYRSAAACRPRLCLPGDSERD